MELVSQLKLAIVPAEQLVFPGQKKTANLLTCGCGVILEAILFRSHHVSTLILGDFDLPLSGGGGGPGVDINVDLVTLRGGRDEHVLASVVATDSGRGRASGIAHSQTVHSAVSHGDAVRRR